MTGSRLRLLFLAAVIGMLLSAAYYTLFAPREMETASPHAFSGPWIYGAPGARFTVTEYADLECPYCRDYFPQLKFWIDTQPDVNLQWHHLPLSIHEPTASRETRLAECVGMSSGNQAFWTVVELIYQQTRSNGAGLPGQLDVSSAQAADLATAVEGCSTPTPEAGQRVQQQVKEAAMKKIDATPTLIITDNLTQRSIKLLGAASNDSLLSAIDWLASDAR
ncbi:protein-disulfide isomerase [Pseudomonas sp. JUb42]|uniref:DsbA family protein n=1 Tax=Pseudomonas sp. JUb42 TaxID=2940611 RepID=UPI002169341A|nr:DsbA family protein [Pseudomonas sp. JUb42]MCS3473011.1 protein-disulfide isomerase [Pseudomonas sp. JUb42]